MAAGSVEGDAPAPPSSADRRLLVVLVLLCLASLPLLVHPWYDATNDGSMYLATARALLSGEGYTFLGEAFRIRPPGMPTLLAPVLAVWGTDFLALNTFVALFGVAAVALFFVFLRERIGAGPAFCAALVVWLNPGFQRSCTQVMSDVPGIALLFLCLVVERRTARRPGGASLAQDVALGLLIAAAAYVRSICVLLAPALVVARVIAGRDGVSWGRFLARRLAVVPAVVFLALLPWSLRDAALAPPPPADQTFLYSYGSGMWHEDAGDPRSRRLSVGEVLARAPIRASQLTEVLGSRQTVVVPSRHRFLAGGEERRVTRPRATSSFVLGGLLLAALLVSFVRRRGTADAFALGAVALLSVYFGFDDRLVLPVFVLAVGAAADLVHTASARLAGRGRAVRVTCALLLAWAVADFRPREGWGALRRQHETFEAIAAEAREALSPDARVAGLVGWHLGVYLERPVYSLNWAIARAGKDPRAAEDVIDRYGVNTLLFSPDIPIDRQYLRYFVERHAAQVLRRPHAVVIRVRE